MRFSKLVVPALMALALGASARASDLAHLDSFTVDSLSPVPLVKLCVTASGEAVGQPCFVSENGIQVASMVLAAGANTAVAPDMGPNAAFIAWGPGIEAMHPDNPGIN